MHRHWRIGIAVYASHDITTGLAEDNLPCVPTAPLIRPRRLHLHWFAEQSAGHCARASARACAVAGGGQPETSGQCGGARGGLQSCLPLSAARRAARARPGTQRALTAAACHTAVTIACSGGNSVPPAVESPAAACSAARPGVQVVSAVLQLVRQLQASLQSRSSRQLLRISRHRRHHRVVARLVLA